MKESTNVLVTDIYPYIGIQTGLGFEIILISMVDEKVNPLLLKEVKRQMKALEIKEFPPRILNR